MKVDIKLPDYVPAWLKISMVTFLVFCVIGLPFWIFVIDTVEEIISIKNNPIASVQPDSLINTRKRSPVIKITKDETTQLNKAFRTKDLSGD